MSLADFLGQLGTALQGPQAAPVGPQSMPNLPGPISGFGGGTFGLDGRQVTPADQDWLHGTAIGQSTMRAPVAQQPRRHGGVRDFLGKLGDALLIGSGGEPLYAKHKAQQQLGEHLAAYLGSTDEALAQILRDDPATGIDLLKLKAQQQPKPEQAPAFVRELQAFGFDPDEQKAIARRRYTRPIIVGNADTGYGVLEDDYGSGDVTGSGGVPAEAAQALLRGEGNDTQFDEVFGPGAAAKVRGGAGGNAGGNFHGL